MFWASIDPGKAYLGLAEWRHRTLIYVTLVWDFTEYFSNARYDLVVVERPWIYPNQRDKRPNDLLDLAVTVGRCYQLAPKLVSYKPFEWKGQVPKRIHHRRIKTSLSTEELAILGDRYANQKDVLDAVGIGLKYLGR